MRHVAALAAIAVAGCPKGEAPPSTPIAIGVVSALTGPNATYGISTQQGADLAADEINAKGGLGGRTLALIHLDDLGEPEQARIAAQRLITNDRVVALIGDATSSGSLAIAPVAQRARVPMVTPAATSPSVTELGDHIFRMSFTDPAQAAAMAVFATKTLKVKRVAVIRALDNEYALGLAEAFRAKLAEAGGEVVADEGYSADMDDLSPIIAAVAKTSPDAVYLPDYHTAVARIAVAARAAGLQAHLLGGDGWDAAELLEDAGAELEGGCFTTHWHPSMTGVASARFVERYRAVYNETPDAIAALGYDTVQLIADAWARAGSQAGLREAIAATEGFDGVTGTIRFDDTGNATATPVVVRIRGGDAEVVPQ